MAYELYFYWSSFPFVFFPATTNASQARLRETVSGSKANISHGCEIFGEDLSREPAHCETSQLPLPLTGLDRGQILLLFCQDVSSPLSYIRALLNSIRAHCHEDKAIVELSQVIIVSQSLIVVEWPLYVAIVAQ